VLPTPNFRIFFIGIVIPLEEGDFNSFLRFIDDILAREDFIPSRRLVELTARARFALA
jgi:hypothetical protein